MPHEPSAFARWVAEREQPPGPLLDVGTGNGRDALWLAGQGFDVTGLDYARSAVELAGAAAVEHGLDARFTRLNLYRTKKVDKLGKALAEDLHPDVLYARFLVHALEDDGRANLWRLARRCLRPGARLYVESRVAETHHAFGEHYRHFVPTEVLVAELEESDCEVVHCEEGYGFAVYKDEDPRVCRIVARRR